ncbi:MAG TPA: MBL fold metallo-hydrolase [Acidimicrobiales bacterium]|nr:MBL fold metallo-hydrolase [Acidimicrobiales bacterium]
MIQAVILSTPELGDRSYLLHDGEVGVAVDPQRDIDGMVAAAEAAGVRIAYVAETHIHNDYLSGGLSLARLLDVPYLVAAAEEVDFDRRPVHDGEEIAVGSGFAVRVVATPGHTPNHVSYVALDRGRPVVACTGGALLFGSVGRTDLSGDSLARSLAHQQFRSAHRLGQLPGSVSVLPTHGFGSFCSVGASAAEASTIAEEREANLAFRAGDEGEFVDTLLAGFGDFPVYYHRMGPRNRRGVLPADLSDPPTVDLDQVSRLARGESWVVDLRPRGVFAAAHLARTINVELDLPLATYLGWLLPESSPLVLMADDAKSVSAARLSLSRIGLEAVAGQCTGPVPPAGADPAVRTYPVRSFADLSDAMAQPGHVALDVRRDDEWRAGHLDAAVHVPLQHLAERTGDLPPGTLWVHCAAGYRAAIAASLLQRAGRDVVLVDGRFTTPDRA